MSGETSRGTAGKGEAHPSKSGKPHQPSKRTTPSVDEGLPSAVVRLGLDGRVRYASATIENLVALRPDILVGKPLPGIFSEPGQSEFRTRFASAILGSAAQRFEIDRHVGGQVRTVQIELIPEVGPEGNATSVVAILVETTRYNVSEERAERAEEKARQAVEKRRAALVESIKALALALEKRDPYTAGHQSRTADLAVRTARKLGLAEEQLRGICCGALIHDIGKLSVPTAILNRPGRLEEQEFELVRTHPQAGYDIVKSVDFPWPVADMILQHHERLDGSGYPEGLMGESILVETRIVSVADVVDAISMHRPYHPAQGLRKALDIATESAPGHYDVRIVRAIQAVIHEDFRAG